MTTVALVATRKGLFKLTDQMKLELVEFVGAPVTMLLANKASPTWYAALNHGHFGVKLHRSDDNGANWKEASAPAYPVAEDREKGDSLEYIWSLEYASNDKNNVNALWAGTVPGGLFYSDDGGESWTLNESLWQHKQDTKWFGGGFGNAGIHSICVDPDDASHVSVAVSCAGVWVTRDGGASWENQSKGMRAAFMPPEKQYDPLIQDPHRLVNCPSNTDVFWAQHHNGIFRSTDASASWQEIENVKPSVFGFAVVVHPQNADTAWFVPGVKDECRIPVDGKFVVTRTRDGGRSFDILSRGLPQEPCYDLVFRHGLDIDATGNRLIMGSTTGNLWFSEDQGESWQNLSHYLPPIYAVRFLN